MPAGFQCPVIAIDGTRGIVHIAPHTALIVIGHHELVGIAVSFVVAYYFAYQRVGGMRHIEFVLGRKGEQTVIHACLFRLVGHL